MARLAHLLEGDARGSEGGERILEDRAQAGDEIVLGVDNAATRIALNRGVSINGVASDMLCTLYEKLEKKGVTLVAVPIPGFYNIADYPSRNKRIPEKETRAAPKPELNTDFEPCQKTWEIIREGYFGRLQHIIPEERPRKEGEAYHSDPLRARKEDAPKVTKQEIDAACETLGCDVDQTPEELRSHAPLSERRSCSGPARYWRS